MVHTGSGAAALDAPYAALNIVRTAVRFLHASHVQHPIYFSNIQIQQLQHIYKSKQMKHLKHALETLVKTPQKHLKTIANICNILMIYSQTYV
jgi:hypothetical protein